MSPRYPTDLTETEWTVLTPLIPAAKPGGRPRTTDMREVINAIFYMLRGGCQWRLLPTEFPPHQTVYHYFRTWRRAGVWVAGIPRHRGVPPLVDNLPSSAQPGLQSSTTCYRAGQSARPWEGRPCGSLLSAPAISA